VLAWARSIRKYRCHDAENQVVLDHHLHPPGHDDKFIPMGGGGGAAAAAHGQARSVGSVSTDHSPNHWIQNQNSTEKSFPHEVTVTDLLDTDSTNNPGQSRPTDNSNDEDDDGARFLS
jgi:hypothetical protein